MFGFLNRFVDSNERELKRIQPYIDATNALEAEFAALSDDEIRARIADIRAEIVEVAEEPLFAEGEAETLERERRREIEKERREKRRAEIDKALDEVLPEVFAAARQAMQRTAQMRHFDVQLIGGVVLHQGKIAEMRTGEGKTLVPTLAAALNALAGRGAHVVTVNDYLARRDAQLMGHAFHFLGVSVGIITHDESYIFEPGYPTTDERLVNLRPSTRQEAYAADVTYGTNNEFGFDYLRDNMVTDLAQRVQRGHYFAVVDEVDNILIDEARTPLIISGQAEESADLYYTLAKLAARLSQRPEGAEEGGDYFVDLKDKAVSPTEEGIQKVEDWLKVENLYDDPRLARHFDAALRAQALFQRDRDYILEDGEIVIVDEFTGRKMPGRRWSEGLHQAIEAKEGLRVQRESVTLATITFQNYFRLYDKLSGMTGTAMTEAEEFHKIYKLEVVAIPTHRPMIRHDDTDLVFRNESGKFTALLDDILEQTEAGRPVLVGTVSVERSEVLSNLLKQRGIKHDVLNAKQHEREANVVAQAGRPGAVTISTNMAGRGTDILLGGNPAGMASEALHKRGLNPLEVEPSVYEEALAEAKAITTRDHDAIVEAGGLHIIGTERHESRRIDNQLRGRAGRQGDPGSSRFYLSLDDDLMKRFASDRVAGLMQRMGLEDDVAIESGIVGRTIESAQTRVEGLNFDIRKRVVEFDDIINRQRETIYGERDKVLRNEDLTETVLEFLDDEVEALIDQFLAGELPDDWNMDGLEAALTAMGITGEGTTADELWDLGTREAISEHLRDLVETQMEARQAEVGAEGWAIVERLVLLRTIDSLWVEHLTEVDDLRRGIGLRGYAQQDPLNEFRREAFDMYMELRALIRHGVAGTIFRVTVTRQAPDDGQPVPLPGPGQPPRPAAEETNGAGPDGDVTTPLAQPVAEAAGGSPGPGPTTASASGGAAAGGSASVAPIAASLPGAITHRQMQAQLGDRVVGSGGPAGGVRPGYTPSGARIGRNDACWCGSGQKYKKCHGR